MTQLYFLPVFISAICFLHYFFTRTFNHWKKKNVKGPVPIPFFGNLIDMALRRKPVGLIYKEIYDQYPEERVIGIYRMTTPSLIIRDLDIVKQVMIKDFEYFPDRGIEFSSEKLGENLFHCGLNTWQVVRNRLTPAFTTSKFRSTFYILDERGDRCIDYVQKACLNQQCQNVYTFFQKYTMATVMAALFGLDVDTFSDEHGLFNLIDKVMLTQTYCNEMDMLYPGVLKKYNISIYCETVIRFCNEIAQTIIKKGNDSQSHRSDVMNTLINLRQNDTVQSLKRENDDNESSIKITDNQLIAGQVFVLFAAGYGNNALSLTYAMYHLAQNTDVQDKLIAEIDEVLQKYDGKVTYDSLKEMKYLNMVFDETLRMHPLTYSISRAVNQDYKIIDTDIKINKGTTVIISPYAIHHDEKNYPDPEKFDPLRFLPEVAGNRHPCAYIPFGAGPRSCLGSTFAKIQFGVCAVKLLSKFRVENSERTVFDKKYDPWRGLFTPLGGLYLNLIPRHQ